MFFRETTEESLNAARAINGFSGKIISAGNTLNFPRIEERGLWVAAPLERVSDVRIDRHRSPKRLKKIACSAYFA